MYIKRSIVGIICILKNIWAKLNILSLLPLCLFFVVLNVLNIHDYLYTNEFSKYFINERMLLLLPVGIGASIIMLLAQYIEESGRELFYLNRKYIVAECVVETVLYSILMSIEFVVCYRPIVGDRLEIYLKYLCYIFAVSGLTVFLCYRIRRASITIMLLLMAYLVEFVSFMTSFFCNFCISSWNYYDVSYVPMMLIMFVVGLTCWRDAYKQIQLYSSYDD